MAASASCDVEWPDPDADPTEFAEAVVGALADKGCCTIQMPISGEDTAEALRLAGKLTDTLAIPAEFGLDYLGRNNCTKAFHLGFDTPDRPLTNVLRVCDRQMTQLGIVLAPLTEQSLGFAASGRTEGLARLRHRSRAEAASLKPEPLAGDDIEGGLVEKHLSFLQSRKVCMLYMIDNDGGELLLHPKDEGEVIIPLSRNMLVLFRHEKVGFEYRPEGSGLALQSWVSAAAASFQLENLQGADDAHDEVVGMLGVPRASAFQAQVMSMSVRFPANSRNSEFWRGMVMYGTDSVVEWPLARFDPTLYYTEDPSLVYLGKSYTHHGGFLSDEEAASLDYDFFGISAAEALRMSANQRTWLEVGYEALHQAGFGRSSLAGKKIGSYLGDVGSDWHSWSQHSSMVHYDPILCATGISSAVCAVRLSHIMGMQGPTMTFDTACSASLYSTHHAHINMLNFHESGQASDGSLTGGVNTLGPSGFVSGAMGNLLSHVGRCFTFNESADGYERCEGSAGAFLKMSDSFDDLELRCAALLGSAASQDGKSASLTAPSGPAQQVLLRHSFRMAGIDTIDIRCTECHGTGTSLGDPIEIGAIAAVFDDEDREAPLLHTTPKVNLGHPEAAAGFSGLTRCILGLQCQVALPNIHLAKLNPHIPIEGFPRLFTSELVPSGWNAAYSGCSSFGFGGADARCDFYARAEVGPASKSAIRAEKLDLVSVTCPKCLGPMCWRCGAAIPSHSVPRRHCCSLLREECGDYEICSICYGGAYRCGTPMRDLAEWDARARISIVGSWDGWAKPTQMDQVEDGVYVCCVVLGDTCTEQFRLVVGDESSALYPPVPRANASSRIMGPGASGRGKYWLIDGVADNQPSGTNYMVTFEWKDLKKLSWEVMCDDPLDLMPIVGQENEHRYFVHGTWNRFGAQEMVRAGQAYEFAFKMTEHGMGREEFYFIRDRDTEQQIYPEVDQCQAESVRIMGPDGGGCGARVVSGSDESLARGGLAAAMRKWRVCAGKREAVTLRLESADGRIMLTVAAARGTKTFRSCREQPGHTYQIFLTCTEALEPMLPDEGSPGVYRCRLRLLRQSFEPFQIVVDEDRSRVMYPSADGAQPGTPGGILLGPDGGGAGLRWLVKGGYGAVFNITLDTNEHDRRKMVSWTAEPGALQ